VVEEYDQIQRKTEDEGNCQLGKKSPKKYLDWVERFAKSHYDKGKKRNGVVYKPFFNIRPKSISNNTVN